MPSRTKPLVRASPPWTSWTRSGTRTNVPWRMTVAPKTPSTAPVNARRLNSRGSTAGSSASKLEQDECDENDGCGKKPDGRRTAILQPAEPSEHGHEKDGRGGRDPARRSIWQAASPASDERGRHRAAARPGRLPRPRTPRPGPRRRTATASRTRRRAAPPMNGPIGGARRDEHVEQAERRAAPVGRRHRPDQGDRGRRHERAADGLEDARQCEELERRARPRPAATPPRRRRRRRGRPAAGRIDRPGCRSRAARSSPPRGTASRARRRSPASTPNSSMMLGRATASIVELSGTSIGAACASIRASMRRREQPAPGRGGGHRRRTIPLVPSISTQPPVGDPRRRVAGPDDGRQPELAGHDGRVRQDAAGVGDEPAGDREQRHPRRVRRRADDDVAGLDRARSRPGSSVDPGRAADDPGRGAGPAHDCLVVRGERGPVEPVRVGSSVVGRPTWRGGSIAAERACSARRSATSGTTVVRGRAIRLGTSARCRYRMSPGRR